MKIIKMMVIIRMMVIIIILNQKNDGKVILWAKTKAKLRNIYFHLSRAKDFLKTDILFEDFELKLQLDI